MNESNGTSLLAAVVAVQAAAGTIVKDKTATVRSDRGSYEYRYASLDRITATIRPLLAEHDLCWLTFPAIGEDGRPVLRYQLAHAPSGESLTGEMPLLLAKPDSQAMGSALTYARRYALVAVLNLVVDEDDDGQAAGAAPSAPNPAPTPTADPEPPRGASAAQRRHLMALVREKGLSRGQLATVLAEFGVELREGWVSRLSPGRTGSASAVIARLRQFATPPAYEPRRCGNPACKHAAGDHRRTSSAGGRPVQWGGCLVAACSCKAFEEPAS